MSKEEMSENEAKFIFLKKKRKHRKLRKNLIYI